MNCPECGTKLINVKKHRINDCTCGARLLVTEINKKLIVEDVTPELDEFKRRKSNWRI